MFISSKFPSPAIAAGRADCLHHIGGKLTNSHKEVLLSLILEEKSVLAGGKVANNPLQKKERLARMQTARDERVDLDTVDTNGVELESAGLGERNDLADLDDLTGRESREAPKPHIDLAPVDTGAFAVGENDGTESGGQVVPEHLTLAIDEVGIVELGRRLVLFDRGEVLDLVHGQLGESSDERWPLLRKRRTSESPFVILEATKVILPLNRDEELVPATLADQGNLPENCLAGVGDFEQIDRVLGVLGVQDAGGSSGKADVGHELGSAFGNLERTPDDDVLLAIDGQTEDVSIRFDFDHELNRTITVEVHEGCRVGEAEVDPIEVGHNTKTTIFRIHLKSPLRVRIRPTRDVRSKSCLDTQSGLT